MEDLLHLGWSKVQTVQRCQCYMWQLPTSNISLKEQEKLPGSERTAGEDVGSEDNCGPRGHRCTLGCGLQAGGVVPSRSLGTTSETNLNPWWQHGAKVCSLTTEPLIKSSSSGHFKTAAGAAETWVDINFPQRFYRPTEHRTTQRQEALHALSLMANGSQLVRTWTLMKMWQTLQNAVPRGTSKGH